MRIDDPVAVNLIGLAFASLPRPEKLFPLTPSSYRYRWKKFLKILAIRLRLTPGALRGCGAVLSYRRGLSIADIQWRMRLKHQATLEYYLQEVAAITALASLDDVSARKVKAASAMFPHLAVAALSR